ncbi:hypothetical protein [Vibrio anguillarum]|uniref:hypothetical protein n=2 Tax=Vibrio TaxID=662 RepID=UPI001695E5CE|nr:hypothetical protein [Vibrio anguillarum]NOI05837.1 hypothetical protein [Vibrio anguillarum]
MPEGILNTGDKTMMILTTLSEKLDDQTGRVFWRVGTKRSGIIDVKIDFSHEESDLISELSAIQYLLFEEQVMGREPGSGSGYKLVVSKGAIKKLARGKSTKKHAQKFAAFLQNRMAGVQIEVSQSREFMADPESYVPFCLNANRQEYANTHDAVVTPTMGTVYVTAHAVEQYIERLSSGDPKKPWASLVNRLKHPELRIRNLPANVLAHKAKKYGTADNVEAWGHPTSKFTYLIVNDNGRRTLVTVFEREQ